MMDDRRPGHQEIKNRQHSIAVTVWIQLVYYYTDRTGRNSFKLKIPIPETINRNDLIDRIMTFK